MTADPLLSALLADEVQVVPRVLMDKYGGHTRKWPFTDAFTDAWTPSEQPFMVLEVRLADEAGGTRYTAMAHHWTVEAKAQHEAMGFHEGWGKATDQLAELVAGLR